jgi:hypothetical protein
MSGTYISILRDAASPLLIRIRTLRVPIGLFHLADALSPAGIMLD